MSNRRRVGLLSLCTPPELIHNKHGRKEKRRKKKHVHYKLHPVPTTNMGPPSRLGLEKQQIVHLVAVPRGKGAHVHRCDGRTVYPDFRRGTDMGNVMHK